MTVGQEGQDSEQREPVDSGENAVSARTRVRVQLVAGVHGRMGADADGERTKADSAATLLVFKLTLETSRKSHHFRSAIIDVHFPTPTDIMGRGRDAPKIAEISPSGHFEIERPEALGTTLKTSPKYASTNRGKAEMSGSLRSGDSKDSPTITARWVLVAGRGTIGELPRSVQLAALLNRGDGRDFRAIFRMQAEIATPAGMATIKGSDNELFFDTSTSFGSLVPPVGREELSKAKMNDLFKLDFRPLESRGQSFFEEWYYLEIWSSQLIGSVVMPHLRSLSLDTKVPGFEGLPCEIGTAFDHESLETYFAWAKGIKPLARYQAARGGRGQKPSERLLSVALLKAKTHQVGRDSQSKALFTDEVLRSLEQHFGLPPGIRDSLVNDAGSFQRVECGRHNYAYIVQTPFYQDETWAAILVTDQEFEQGSYIIHPGSSTSIPQILRATHKGVSPVRNYSHPLRLLFELYLDHYRTTRERLERVLRQVKSVDDEIEKELQMPQRTFAKKGQTSLAQLSQTLHEARTHLSQLSRRLQFELQICMRLQEDLADDDELADPVNMYSVLTRGHAAEVKALPDRINSQSTVLYSLISQRDANSQYDIAAETARDSKAMKTLAVITIIFLPGTFVATLFSTDIFDFQPGQEGKLYLQVVVPFTVLVFMGWLWWMRMKPVMSDLISQAEKGSKQS